jgi:hypothetical protein
VLQVQPIDRGQPPQCQYRSNELRQTFEWGRLGWTYESQAWPLGPGKNEDACLLLNRFPESRGLRLRAKTFALAAAVFMAMGNLLIVRATVPDEHPGDLDPDSVLWSAVGSYAIGLAMAGAGLRDHSHFADTYNRGLRRELHLPLDGPISFAGCDVPRPASAEVAQTVIDTPRTIRYTPPLFRGPSPPEPHP